MDARPQQLSVAVLGGAGLMGRRIGAQFALYGHNVTLIDLNDDKLTNALSEIKNMYDIACDQALITDADKDRARDCVSKSTDRDNYVESADLVIEAASEHIGIKKQLCSACTPHMKHNAVFLSNTMSCSITEIAEAAVAPERVLGVRFLFPVFLIPDVEITVGAHTSPRFVDQVISVLRNMDLEPFYRGIGDAAHIRLHEGAIPGKQRETAEKRRLRLQSKNGHGGATPSAPPIDLRYTSAASVYASDGDVGLARQQQEAAIAREAKPAEASKECKICMDNCKNSVFTPCGHMVACFDCASQLKSMNQVCPICRARIGAVVRVFDT